MGSKAFFYGKEIKMQEIVITVKNKKAIVPEGTTILTGNSGIKARFVFDGEWENVGTKTARFIYSDGYYHDVILINDRCDVPPIYNTAFVMIGVFAGGIKSTASARIGCVKSVLDESWDKTPTVDKTSYAMLCELIDTRVPTNDKSGQILVTGEEGVNHWEDKVTGGYGGIMSPVQLIPEYAYSKDDCADKTKPYLLPDGFIYGYATKSVTVEPTNQIPLSVNAEGGQYIGANSEEGYNAGHRLNSSGAETAQSGWCVSGFIPAKFGDTLRFSGITGDASSTNTRICFYDASFQWLGLIQSSDAENAFSSGIYTISNENANIASGKKLEDAVYFRVSATSITNASFITVNQSLEPSTETVEGWFNTGHAFVPADYEDRIIVLEEKTDELAVGITEDVPNYIEQEAARAADTVQANRTAGSLTFTAMSDFHVEADTTNEYGLKDNLTSCRDAGLALAELQKHLKLDFAAMLGDYTWGSSTNTVTQVKKDLTYVKNRMTEGVKGIPSIWCTGNHDINYGANSDRRMTEDELYAYITANNNGTVKDSENIGRNYGYIDFDNQKIRCIYLNTVDALDYPDSTNGTADDASEVTAVQTKWLAEVALNLTNKPAPEKWGIVVLSHHCVSIFQNVTKVLTAYKNGTSGSVDVTTNGVTTTVTYNFTNAQRGEIICAVHGHNHNFIAKKISDEPYNNITAANAWLWSIGVPNVDTTRNNEAASSSDTTWKNAFGEFDENAKPVYYPKTQGEAKSTSFCIITVDRKNRKIHAVAYGAGVDRKLTY